MPKQDLPFPPQTALIRAMRLAAHVPSAGLLVAFLALPLLSSCANSVYYQTRYVPTSSEGAFSLRQILDLWSSSGFWSL